MTVLFATLLFSFAGVMHGLLWLLLIVTMFLLIGVILLQEGKGGGLAEAFGGAGAETFGVKAHGINKFTALVGGVFLLLCVVLAKFKVEPDATPLNPDYKPPVQRNNDPGSIDPMENDIPSTPLENGAGDGSGAGAGTPPASSGAGGTPPASGGVPDQK